MRQAVTKGQEKLLSPEDAEVQQEPLSHLEVDSPATSLLTVLKRSSFLFVCRPGSWVWYGYGP